MKDYTFYPDILSETDSYETNRGNSNSSIPTPKFYLPFLGVIWRSNRKAKHNIYNGINWGSSSVEIMRLLENVGVKFNIEGLDNIRNVNSPVIFVSNHMSTLETMVLPGIINPIKKVVFVMKEELVKYPFFGIVSGVRHPILVGRANPREDLKIVMDEGKNRINDGRSIVIFPQKTRSDYFIPDEFNTLGVKLAKRNSIPIIPVAIVSNAWGNGKLIKDFGKIDPKKEVYISFGKPLEIIGNGAEEHQKSIDFIKSKFMEWGSENLIK